MPINRQAQTKFEQALTRIERDTSLIRLDLSHLDAAPDEQLGLMDFSRLVTVLVDKPALQSLDLSGNRIGMAGLKLSLEKLAVATLDFSFNGVGSEAIENAFEHDCPQCLLLEGNSINTDAARVLAQQKRLQTLNLACNGIDDQGALAFANNNTLLSLNLSANKLTQSGLNYLLKNGTLLALYCEENQLDTSATELIQAMLTRNAAHATQYLEACKAGDLERIQDFLEKKQVSPYACEGFNAEGSAKTLFTGLHLAVIHAQTDVILWLKSTYPALLDMVDASHKTPAQLARARGNEEVVTVLAAKAISEIMEQGRSEGAALAPESPTDAGPSTGHHPKAETTLKTVLLGLMNDSSVKRLDLSQYESTFHGEIRLGDLDIVRGLSESRTLSELNLSSNVLDPHAVKIIASNAALRTLNLSQCALSPSSAVTIVESAQASILDVSGNLIGNTGAVTCAKNKSFVVLDLSGNVIGDPGLLAFAENTTLINLKINRNNITNAAITELAEKSKTLLNVNVQETSVDEKGMKILSDALTSNREVAKKFLDACQTGNLVMIQVLLSEKVVSPYVTLGLLENQPEKDGATGLHLAVKYKQAEVVYFLVKYCPQLVCFRDHAGKTPFELPESSADAVSRALRGEAPAVVRTERLARRLSNFEGGPKQEYLDLSAKAWPEEEKLTAEDAKSLAIFSHQYPQLRSVNLAGNKIADEGLSALLLYSTFERLNVKDNSITGSSLGSFLVNKTLKHLNLSENPLENRYGSSSDLSEDRTWISRNLSLWDSFCDFLKQANHLLSLDVSNTFCSKWFSLHVGKSLLALKQSRAPEPDSKFYYYTSNADYWLSRLQNGVENIFSEKSENITYRAWYQDSHSLYDEVHPLQFLDLSGHHIQQIWRGNHKKPNYLQSLNASHNQINDEGLGYFKRNVTLVSADLSYNKLTNEGARKLAESRTLLSLNVEGNSINLAGQREILAMLQRNRKNARLFFEACMNGDHDTIANLLRNHAVSPYACTGKDFYNRKSCYTGLHIAVLYQQADVLTYLATYYPRLLKYVEAKWRTPAQLAAELGYTAMLALLEPHKPSPPPVPEIAAPTHSDEFEVYLVNLKKDPAIEALDFSTKTVSVGVLSDEDIARFIAVIGPFKKLSKLSMSGRKLNQENLEAIVAIETVTDLDISDVGIKREKKYYPRISYTCSHDLSCFKSRDNIRVLKLGHNKISGEMLASVLSITSLRGLDLSFNKALEDKDWDLLAENRNLLALSVRGSYINAKKAAKNRTLREIDISGQAGKAHTGNYNDMAKNMVLLSLKADKASHGTTNELTCAAEFKVNRTIWYPQWIDDGGAAHKGYLWMKHSCYAGVTNKIFQACKRDDLNGIEYYIKEDSLYGISPYICDYIAGIEDVLDHPLQTLLHVAVINSSKTVAQFLVRQYPHLLNLINRAGKTPMDLAKEKKNERMIRILENRWVDSEAMEGVKSLLDRVNPFPEKEACQKDSAFSNRAKSLLQGGDGETLFFSDGPSWSIAGYEIEVPLSGEVSELKQACSTSPTTPLNTGSPVWPTCVSEEVMGTLEVKQAETFIADNRVLALNLLARPTTRDTFRFYSGDKVAGQPKAIYLPTEALQVLTRSRTLVSLVVEDERKLDPKVFEKMKVTLRRNRLSAHQFLQACKTGNLDTVRHLLDNKDVSPYVQNVKQDSDWDKLASKGQGTGLHMAVLYQQIDVINYFFLHHPDLQDVPDCHGKIPMKLAEKLGKKDSIEALEGKKISLDMLTRLYLTF